MPRPNNKHEENTPTKTLNASLGLKTRGKIKCLDTDSLLLTPPATPSRTPTKSQRSDRTSPIPLLPPPKNRKSSVSQVVANPTNNNCRKSITFCEHEAFPIPARVPTSLINSLKQLGTDLGNLISPPNTPSTIPSLSSAHPEEEKNHSDISLLNDLTPEATFNKGPDKTNEESLIQTEKTEEDVPDDVEVIAVIPRILKKATIEEQSDQTKCYPKAKVETKAEDSQEETDSELGHSVSNTRNSSDLYIIQKVKLLRKTSTEYNSFSLDNESVNKTLQNKETLNQSQEKGKSEEKSPQKEIDIDTGFSESLPNDNSVSLCLQKDQDIDQFLKNDSTLNQSLQKDLHLCPSDHPDKAVTSSLPKDQDIDHLQKEQETNQSLQNEKAVGELQQKDAALSHFLHNEEALSESCQEEQDTDHSLVKDTSLTQSLKKDTAVSQYLQKDNILDESVQNDEALIQCVQKEQDANEFLQIDAVVNQSLKTNTLSSLSIQNGHESEKVSQNLGNETSESKSLQSDKSKAINKSLRKNKTSNQCGEKTTALSTSLNKNKVDKQVLRKEKVAKKPSFKEKPLSQLSCKENVVRKSQRKHKIVSEPLNESIPGSLLLQGDLKENKDYKEERCKRSVGKVAVIPKDEIEIDSAGKDHTENHISKRKSAKCGQKQLAVTLKDEVEFHPIVENGKAVRVSKRKTSKQRTSTLTDTQIEEIEIGPPIEERRVQKRKIRKCRPGDLTDTLSDEIEFDSPVKHCKEGRVSKKKTHKYRLGELTGDEIECNPSNKDCEEIRVSKRKSRKQIPGQFTEDEIEFDPASRECKGSRNSKRNKHKFTRDEIEFDHTGEYCKESRVSKRKTQKCKPREFSENEVEFDPTSDDSERDRVSKKKTHKHRLGKFIGDKIEFDPTNENCKLSKVSKRKTDKHRKGELTEAFDFVHKECKGSRGSRSKTRGCKLSELTVVSNDEAEFHAGGEGIKESRASTKKKPKQRSDNINLSLIDNDIGVQPLEQVCQGTRKSKKNLSSKQLKQPLDELSSSISLEGKSTDTISKICEDFSLCITENSVPCLSVKRPRGRPPAKKLDLVLESKSQSPQASNITPTEIATSSRSKKPRDKSKPKQSRSQSIVGATPFLIPDTSKLEQEASPTKIPEQSFSTDSKNPSSVPSLPTKRRYIKTGKTSIRSKKKKPSSPITSKEPFPGKSQKLASSASKEPHSSSTSQEPHRPSRNIQQPARYLDSLDTATKDSIAVMRLHQMKRGKSLTYDLNNLSWNKDHTVNEQGVYCYCGDSGSWYSKMVQCSRCLQWFHERCLAPRPMAMPIIFGDLFYLFVCSSCNHGSECLKRMDMSWTDLVHLALFDLTVKTSRTFHDLEKDLVPEILSNWSLFQMPKLKNALSETEKKEMICDVLAENKDRFTNGLDAEQSETLWGLGLLSPPPRPNYKVPELGIVSERTVLSEVVVNQPKYNPNAENVMPTQDMIVKYDQYVFPTPKLKRARKRPSSKMNESALLEKNQSDLDNKITKKRLKLDSSHHSISINPGKEANAFQIQVNFLKKKHKTSGKSTFRLEKINLKVQKLKKPREEKINKDQDCSRDPNTANDSLENISLKVQKIKKPREKKVRKDRGSVKELSTLNNISLRVQKIRKTRENRMKKNKATGKKSSAVIGGLNDISLKYRRLREKKIKMEHENTKDPSIENNGLEKINLRVRKFRKPREKKNDKDLQSMKAPILRNGDQEKAPTFKKLRDKKNNKDQEAIKVDYSSNDIQVPSTSNGVTTRSLANANPLPKSSVDVRVELNKRLHKELGIRVAMKFAEVTPKPKEEVEALLQAQSAGPRNKRKNYKEYKKLPMLLPDTCISSSFMDTLIPPPQNYNESNNPFKNNLRRLTEKDLNKKRKKKDKLMVEESRQLSSSTQSVNGNKEGSNSPQILNGNKEVANSSQFSNGHTDGLHSLNGNNEGTSSTNGNKRSTRIRCTRSSQSANSSNESTSSGSSQSFLAINNGGSTSQLENGNNKDEFSFKIPYGNNEDRSSSQIVNENKVVNGENGSASSSQSMNGNDDGTHGDENYTRDRLKGRVLSSDGTLRYLMTPLEMKIET